MRLFFKIIITIVALVPCFTVNAQIFRGSADSKDTTSYLINGRSDSIFVFFDATNNYIIGRAPVDSTTTFHWSVYNHALNNYTDLRTDIDTISIFNIATGINGYRLITNNVAGTDTFRCWTYVPGFNVHITSSLNDTIKKANIFCGLIDNITAALDTASVYYYNPTNAGIIKLIIDYAVTWTSNQTNASPPVGSQGNQLIATVPDPYWRDTWYIAQAKDKYGTVRRDSAYYKSIEPHANFTDRYIPLNDSEYYEKARLKDTVYLTFYSSSYSEHSAPAIFEFNNLSENADSLIWFYGDKQVKTDSSKVSIHTYILPGNYTAKLVAVNKSSYDGCIDSITSNDISNGAIVVAGPKINNGSKKAPNVLVIGADQPLSITENHWRLYDDISITEIEIAIYSRYGEKVHYFKGNIRDWDGWDGTKRGTGKYVQTGVYYFVVKKLDQLPKYDSNDANITDPYDVKKEELRNFIHVFNVSKNN